MPVNRVSQRVEGCASFLAITPTKAVETLEWHPLSQPSAFVPYVDLVVPVGFEQTRSLAGNRDKFCAKPRWMGGSEKRFKVCLISIHKENPRPGSRGRGLRIPAWVVLEAGKLGLSCSCHDGHAIRVSCISSYNVFRATPLPKAKLSCFVT